MESHSTGTVSVTNRGLVVIFLSTILFDAYLLSRCGLVRDQFLSDALDTRKIREDALRRMAQGTVSPYARRSDPSGLCSVPDPFAGGVGYPAVRGYRYEGHTATGKAVEAVKGSVRGVGKGGRNVGNITEKLDTNDIPNMTKQEIINKIPNDWNYTDHNGFVHIKDASGKIRIRIDPPDRVTDYPHVHVYDSNGNLLDSFGNIVDRRSPDGHIPYKDK